MGATPPAPEAPGNAGVSGSVPRQPCPQEWTGLRVEVESKRSLFVRSSRTDSGPIHDGYEGAVGSIDPQEPKRTESVFMDTLSERVS